MPDKPELEKAIRLVLAMLPQDRLATRDDIRDAATPIQAMLAAQSDSALDLEEIVRAVEGLIVVWQDEGATLHDQRGHEEWLAARRADINWQFWERYRRYLEDVKFFPPAVIRRLDQVTDSVLKKLEFPGREGSWDRRGLVVGQVQSGKTANYTGLICKAADAGYKLILVLAGTQNSLRSQTQLRVDEGFLGYDTQFQRRYDEGTDSAFGVGLLPGAPRLKSGSLTTSAESGDFRTTVAKQLALPIGDYPVILVVKKHGGILRNIQRWMTSVHGVHNPETKEVRISDVPLLIIDDEADNASIDTKSPANDGDPTTINREIRRLLKSFDKSAYVGYTATPFANIYIGAYVAHEEFGEDLFPRSFIESLKPPSNYFGPIRVFGLADDEEGETEPLPIHRSITDHQAWMPDRHKIDWTPSAIPESLEEALLSFVLVCAARAARGQETEHNSMLVHVTRFVAVQNKVADQVTELVDFLRDRIRYGDGEAPEPLLDSLRELWENNFVPTTDADVFVGDELPLLDWDQIHPHLLPAIEKMEIRTINGSSKDALEYYEHRRTGLNVIAVGGAKLSRGLTLEGLSVSYYLRSSRMYDTLMQMGRWFGFRPGYEDLCRLYTTTELRSWYREITAASEELRAELEEMAAKGATPEDYGLRVRASSAGLAVTAPNKMKRAQRIKLSYSGDLSETVLFDTRVATLKSNALALDNFIHRLDQEGSAHPNLGNVVWNTVSPESVLGFLDGYQIPRMARRVRPELLKRYIEKCNDNGELTSWTVALVSNQQTKVRRHIGPHEVGLTFRNCIDQDALRTEHRYSIRRVLSPPDELIGLSKADIDVALDRTRQRRQVLSTEGTATEIKVPSGIVVRQMRPATDGLLLIYPLDPRGYAEWVDRPMVGWAISFPGSDSAVETEYFVNEIWNQLAFDDMEDDE